MNYCFIRCGGMKLHGHARDALKTPSKPTVAIPNADECTSHDAGGTTHC